MKSCKMLMLIVCNIVQNLGVMEISSLVNNEHSKICKIVYAHFNTKFLFGVTKSCISQLLYLCNRIFLDKLTHFRLVNGCFSRKFLKKSGQIPEIVGKGETFRKFTEWKICKKENALLELKKISSLLNNEHSNICKKV